MKFVVDSKLIEKDIKKKKDDYFWIEFVDNKIVNFEDNNDIAILDTFIIHKDWCKPLEEKTSKELIILNKIKNFCEKEIKNFCEKEKEMIKFTDVSKYNTCLNILNIIYESEDKNHD